METITLTVNTTVDENDGREGGEGLSLRDAIAIANQSPENNYIIELQGGATYTLNVDSGDPGDNHLDIEQGNVTIRATGEGRATIDASGLENPDVVLHILSEANVDLENLTITGGVAEGNDNVEGLGSGGGLYIAENSIVTITNSVITGNSAADDGGGIAVSNSEVNIYSSSIINNSSSYSGAGIHVNNYNSTSVVSIVNSTISGNVADYVGGGVYLDFLSFIASGNDVQVDIDNSTITNNTANADLDDPLGGAGGGIATGQDDRIAVSNSIVTGNFDGRDNTPSDVSGFFYTDFIFAGFPRGIIGDSNNIVGTTDAEFGTGTIGTGSDIVIVGADSLLTPLQDNGGAIQTHALLENSPAIDAGNNASIPADRFDLDGDGNTEEPIPFDQTGSDRIINNTIDIGAVEFGPASNTPNTPNNNSNEDPNTVYRFFNNDTGVHFYTADETERDAVEELPNFSFEGESYQAVDPLTGMPEPLPVYRFLNEDTGVHLYTISETERDATEELNNFSFEGEAFFAYESGVEDSIPIYRFFNPTTGAHFYTPSEAERDNVEANLPEFNSEGIAYYALLLESEVI